MEELKIKFKTEINNLQSIKFHPLSKNGPFFDAHLGDFSTKMPIGQTYYIRPFTEFIPPCKKKMKEGCGCGGKGEGTIKFSLKECFPTTHANTNSICDDFKLKGSVKISPFNWDKDGIAVEFSNQIIEVNLIIKNKTGLEMKGFHIHDGQMKDGLVGFGPISYFLYTGPTWIKYFNNSKKSISYIEKYLPLPYDNIIQKDHNFLIEESKKN